MLHFLQNLADQLNNKKVDSLIAENVRSDVSPAERKRKAEHETTDKIAKIKNASETSSSGPNLEHLAQVWLPTANFCCVIVH